MCYYESGGSHMDGQLSFQKVVRWSEDECREFLERMRWPDGPCCPKCGAEEPWKITRRTQTKNAVRSLYRCRACKRQFTATVGTIFEDSKIPLSKWFAAIYLMCASKKGISAHQLHRQLDITYKSSWFMCHRIREAMRDKDGSPLKGVIEADETYVGGKTRRGHPIAFHERQAIDLEARGLKPLQYLRGRRHPRMEKAVVFGIMERDGRVRTIHVPEATARTLVPLLRKNVDPGATVITDAHSAYRLVKRHLAHKVIQHDVAYVDGDVHTQGIENYWSLLKRGVIGVFHHVSVGHLPQYLDEFQYRFNRRKIRDEDRFASLMGQIQGRVLWYCQTPQPENPYA
jgi:transposase-like protein